MANYKRLSYHLWTEEEVKFIKKYLRVKTNKLRKMLKTKFKKTYSYSAVAMKKSRIRRGHYYYSLNL